MAWPSLPTLVALLKSDPSKQNASEAGQEAQLMEDVAVQFSSTYEFVTPNSPSNTAFTDLFDALVHNRLLNEKWRSAIKPDHLLRVLQCTRLMSRDNTLRIRFVDLQGVQVMATLFRQEARSHFSGNITPFQIEVLTECASIVKRLAGDEWGLKSLVACEVHATLTHLLNSTDPAVLPLVLVALIGFAAHKDYFELIAHATALETLLRIVQQYDLPFKRLAADLIALLARREIVVAELLQLNGLGRIIGQLQTGDAHLTQSLLRVVCYMAADMGAVNEMYQVGSVPVLVSLAGTAVKEVAADPTCSCLASGRITEMQLVCTALTRLAEDDELAVQIRQCNGITLLGKLLLVHAAASDEPKAVDKSQREVESLRAYVFRVLRYLFSVERNRKAFKRLLPPDLFAAFIDIGHYNAALTAYTPLVKRFDELTPKQLAGLSAALDDISLDRESQLRTVHGYVILEMLGKGAFGAVYKARRTKGEMLVALKELPITDIGIFGATDAERDAGVVKMCKEVEILSSLNHPNIVQYYESFTDGPYLFISMELVEGVSLLDHLTSLAEKGRRMPEADIWQVFIAVSLALSYIHGQKKIVHRDLTPGNIVLGQGPEGLRHTKIADFGLAKRLSNSAVAQSVVGTMPYTCPEIIQQEHYTEKADIWSMGCVLYHMMMLHSPFDGTNPLSVASKIVEGNYEPVTDPPGGQYSTQLKQLVRLMMTVDPNRRPGIEDVAALVAGQLMGQLERMASTEERILKSLQVERTHNRARRNSVTDYSASPQRGLGGMRRTNTATTVDSAATLNGSPRSLQPIYTTEGSLDRASSNGDASEYAGGIVQPMYAPGASRTVALACSRLKPVNDPLANVLSQLHKVMWVEQLPPGLSRDHRRRAVESFRRHLFGAGSSAASLKLHMAKLMASQADVITDVAGRPVDFGSVPLGAEGGEGPGVANDGCLTYDQLHQIIESILNEKGYYTAVIQEAAELLEPSMPNFAATLIPGWKQ